MIKYTIEDLLQALKIEDNPNAAEQFAMFIFILAAFIGLAVLFKNFPLILKRKIDRDLYNFLKEFKGLDEDEIYFIEKIVKKYKIKEEYELFILESVFDKYADRERINIEAGYIPVLKKQEEIGKIEKIRKKIFGNKKSIKKESV